ncbi:hypothetical protein JCM31271_11590 [Halorubrum trueperi]
MAEAKWVSESGGSQVSIGEWRKTVDGRGRQKTEGSVDEGGSLGGADRPGHRGRIDALHLLAR